MKKKIVFGIFKDGKLIVARNTIMVEPKQAEMVCMILDAIYSKGSIDGEYFAWDYAENLGL